MYVVYDTNRQYVARGPDLQGAMQCLIGSTEWVVLYFDVSDVDFQSRSYTDIAPFGRRVCFSHDGHIMPAYYSAPAVTDVRTLVGRQLHEMATIYGHVLNISGIEQQWSAAVEHMRADLEAARGLLSSPVPPSPY